MPQVWTITKPNVLTVPKWEGTLSVSKPNILIVPNIYGAGIAIEKTEHLNLLLVNRNFLAVVGGSPLLLIKTVMVSFPVIAAWTIEKPNVLTIKTI